MVRGGSQAFALAVSRRTAELEDGSIVRPDAPAGLEDGPMVGAGASAGLEDGSVVGPGRQTALRLPHCLPAGLEDGPMVRAGRRSEDAVTRPLGTGTRSAKQLHVTPKVTLGAQTAGNLMSATATLLGRVSLYHSDAWLACPLQLA